ncbi:AbiH family protein [Salinicola endophyticus]|uniref:AbiH family protein n=1 Tax=Salinicola endophyticus TaxID=1949083 RepID=A0AB74UE06_9GAMM
MQELPAAPAGADRPRKRKANHGHRESCNGKKINYRKWQSSALKILPHHPKGTLMSFRLFVIGNGFDLFHKLSSSLADFSRYVKQKNPNLHETIDEYLQLEGNWNTLEMSLADFDAERALDEALEFLQPYSTENWKDAYHHEYQYELGKTIAAVSTELLAHFYNWIDSLDTTCLTPKPQFNFSQSDIFLTFNYTNTLEDVYSIEATNTLSIHGSISNGEDLILGHAWDPEEIPDYNNVPNPEDLDTRVMEGNEMVNSYFQETFKPTDEIIEEHHSFFEQLREASMVIIIGHSLSCVDRPYFEEIYKNTPLDITWLVTYHSEEDKANHLDFLISMGIENFKQCNTQDIAQQLRYLIFSSEHNLT